MGWMLHRTCSIAEETLSKSFCCLCTFSLRSWEICFAYCNRGTTHTARKTKVRTTNTSPWGEDSAAGRKWLGEREGCPTVISSTTCSALVIFSSCTMSCSSGREASGVS